jgi:hypothetical protein
VPNKEKESLALEGDYYKLNDLVDPLTNVAKLMYLKSLSLLTITY